MKTTKKNVEELVQALRHAHTSLKELASGWPQRELHEPVETTLKRSKTALKRNHSDPDAD